MVVMTRTGSAAGLNAAADSDGNMFYVPEFGYNRDNPIKSRDVTFNILAPGVMSTHYTLGAIYALSDKSEVTLSCMNAPSNSVSGASLFNGFMGGMAGNESIKLAQQALARVPAMSAGFGHIASIRHIG